MQATNMHKRLSDRLRESVRLDGVFYGLLPVTCDVLQGCVFHLLVFTLHADDREMMELLTR